MVDKLSAILRKFASGWLVLVFLAGEIFFNAVILPAQQAKMETGPIDLNLFYTPEKVYSMVESYGEAGRANYRLFELTGDIIYPIVYTLFFRWRSRGSFSAVFHRTAPCKNTMLSLSEPGCLTCLRISAS